MTPDLIYNKIWKLFLLINWSNLSFFLQDCEAVWDCRDEAVKKFCKENSVEIVECVSHTLWNPFDVIEANAGIPPLTYDMFLVNNYMWIFIYHEYYLLANHSEHTASKGILFLWVKYNFPCITFCFFYYTMSVFYIGSYMFIECISVILGTFSWSLFHFSASYKSSWIASSTSWFSKLWRSQFWRAEWSTENWDWGMQFWVILLIFPVSKLLYRQQGNVISI